MRIPAPESGVLNFCFFFFGSALRAGFGVFVFACFFGSLFATGMSIRRETFAAGFTLLGLFSSLLAAFASKGGGGCQGGGDKGDGEVLDQFFHRCDVDAR